MIIEIIKCLKDNYSYLIIDEKLNTACVVDPSESEPIINYLDNNQVNVYYKLNTLTHHREKQGANAPRDYSTILEKAPRKAF